MKFILYILFFIPFIGITQIFTEDQQDEIDRLNSIINNSFSHDTALANAYYRLSEIIYVSNFDTIIPLCEKSVKISEKGLLLYSQPEIKESLLRSFAGSVNNIGYFYKQHGDISNALKYYHQSLKIHDEIGYEIGAAGVLNNIGAIYIGQHNLEQALSYFEQALEIQIKIEDKKGEANSLNSIGNVYESNNELEKALKNYKIALKLFNEEGAYYGGAQVLDNIAGVYKIQGNDSKALENLFKSLELSEKLGDEQGMSKRLTNIGEIELNRGNIVKAKNYIDRGFTLAKKTGFPFLIDYSAKLLSKVYEHQNKGLKSLEMYKLHIVMRDSVNDLNFQRTIAEEQAKYEYEKQKAIDDAEYQYQKAIENAENEKLLALKQEEKEKQQIITYFIGTGLVLVVGFLFFIFNRLKVTKKQKAVIESQKEITEIAHREITDSINYTKYLQDAILPSFEEVNNFLPNNFIFFKPKNIVSGDFYWFEHVNNASYLAVADCTGHGVPGAMLSAVCSNALNRALKEFVILDPAAILDKTRKLVIETFAKSGEDVKDGMDISLCRFKNKKLTYSGANNPIWIVRKIENLTNEQKKTPRIIIDKSLALVEYKANKQPVGLFDRMHDFEQKEIELFSGDIIYLFTDGYADQFGGVKGKKYKYKPFKKMLISLYEKPMKEQLKIVNQVFEEWKNDLEQVDDVCVMGIKIN